MEMKNESNAYNGDLGINEQIERAKQLRSEAIAGFFRQAAKWIHARKTRATAKADFDKFSMPGMHKPCH